MSDIKKQVVEELHKPARKTFKRRHVLVKGIDDLIQIDLIEVQPYARVNKGFRYILVAINVFSKFVWAQPVRRKTGKDVTAAMKKILNQAKYTPKNIQSDNGKEFYNKEFRALMEAKKINHYSTYSSLKASVVERVNRTLKNIMWKYFSYQGSYKWLNLLQKIVSEYNNRKHSTIKMKPKDVTRTHEKKLLNTVYNRLKTMDPRKVKLKKGDFVRISKYREAFSKGYTPNWSNEIFKIKQVKQTNPTTYILEDSEKELILGNFYESELQKTLNPDVFLVQKIVKKTRR